MRDLTNRDLRFDVDSLSLRCRNRTEGLDLTIVKSRRPSEISKTNRAWVDAMKLGKSAYRIMPPKVRESCLCGLKARCSHFVSRIRSNARERRVFDYPAVQEFHNIEWGSYHLWILTQAVGLWDGNIGLLQGMDDPILPFDLVGCLGKQTPWRLLAYDISLTIGCRELISWIRLSEAELRQGKTCVGLGGAIRKLVPAV